MTRLADPLVLQSELDALRGKLSLTCDDYDAVPEAWNLALHHTTPRGLYQELARIWPHKPDLHVSVNYDSQDGSSTIVITPDENDKRNSFGRKSTCDFSFTITPGDKIDTKTAFLPACEQGKGISSKFMRMQLNMAHVYDCKKIVLHAANEVGGYTWVRMGFKPDEDTWRNNCQPMLKRLCRYTSSLHNGIVPLGKTLPLPDDAHYALLEANECASDAMTQQGSFFVTRQEYEKLVHALSNPDAEDAFLFANMDRVVGKTADDVDITLGQALLCGEGYYAELPIDDPENVQYLQFRRYLHERLQKLEAKSRDNHERR